MRCQTSEYPEYLTCLCWKLAQDICLSVMQFHMATYSQPYYTQVLYKYDWYMYVCACIHTSNQLIWQVHYAEAMALRPQGGPSVASHPAGPQFLIMAHPDSTLPESAFCTAHTTSLCCLQMSLSTYIAGLWPLSVLSICPPCLRFHTLHSRG